MVRAAIHSGEVIELTQWKTIALRIRGAKTELEDMGEDTSNMALSTAKLREQVMGLTKGFDIMADEKTFKSTYDIVVGISDVFKDMSDIDQAALLELLAGKRGANVLQAAITNVDRLKSACDDAQNSAGSAMREYQNWERGIEAATQKFEASFQAMSDSIIGSDLIKFFVNLGTGATSALTSIIEKFDALPVAATALGGILGFKGAGIFGDNGNSNEYALYLRAA